MEDLGWALTIRYTYQVELPDTPKSGATLRPESDEGRFYIDQIKSMREFEITTLYVDFTHLLEREEVLARAIQDQYYRWVLSVLGVGS